MDGGCGGGGGGKVGKGKERITEWLAAFQVCFCKYQIRGKSFENKDKSHST